MAWKPKTIAGKILKGALIGVGAAATAVGAAVIIGGSGGAAAPAVVTGGGKLLSKIFKGAKKVVDVVGTKAKDLITGVTAEQRGIIHQQKDEQRADVQKLNAIDKLIKAGATVEEAASKIGVPLSALKGLFGIPSDAEAEAKVVMTTVREENIEPIKQGCLVWALILIAIPVGSIVALLIL